MTLLEQGSFVSSGLRLPPLQGMSSGSFYGLVSNGTTLNGLNTETRVTKVVAAPGTADVVTETEIPISFNAAIPGDHIVLVLYRDASAGNPDDTLAANVYVVALEADGYFWRP